MFEVTIEEAEKNLEELIEKACLGNFSFIITKNGLPFVRVDPIKDE